MFPSSGFFKGIICPYLASGLCERPYCHYKHAVLPRAEDKRSSTVSTPGSSDVSSLNDVQHGSFDSSTTVVEVASNNISSANQFQSRQLPSMLNMVGSAICKVQSRGCNEKVICYKPTPKFGNKSDAITSVVQENCVKEYVPTPIHLLKRMKSKTDVLEYDPVSNYSTNIGPQNFVRVTLADAEKETLKRPLEDTEKENEAVSSKRQKFDKDVYEIEAKYSEEEALEGASKNGELKGKVITEIIADSASIISSVSKDSESVICTLVDSLAPVEEDSRVRKGSKQQTSNLQKDVGDETQSNEKMNKDNISMSKANKKVEDTQRKAEGHRENSTERQRKHLGRSGTGEKHEIEKSHSRGSESSESSSTVKKEKSTDCDSA